MIKLELVECQNFVVLEINYEKQEMQIRERNADITRDLLALMRDSECLSLLEGKNKVSDSDLPAKIDTFYKTYFKMDVSKSNILKDVRREYQGLKVKIVNFANMWSFEKEFVKNKLLDDDNLFLLAFVKNPEKQTFHQHYAAKWLKSIPFVEDFEELNPDGKTARYICSGKIICGQVGKTKSSAKSLDFAWKYTFGNKTLQFFATHKYTKDNGGSQDHQYNEVKNFHSEAKSCEDGDICLLSITDGPYYLRPFKKDGFSGTKLDYLKQGFVGSRNCATTLHTFITDVIPYIILWLETNFNEEAITKEREKLLTFSNIVLK